MRSSGYARQKHAQKIANITTKSAACADVNTQRRGGKNSGVRISGGGKEECRKTETDADCLNCPNGFDDDEGVYCGVIQTDENGRN